jgi:hypothetical protein
MADKVEIRSRPTARRDPITPSNPRPERKPTDKATVDRAVAAMESFYALIHVSLRGLKLDGALELWEESQDDLEQSNRDALTASPKLAASLARVGESTGVLAFAAGNAMVMMPVMQLARMELQDRITLRNAKKEAAQNGTTAPDVA